jgi:hypothetical protein
MGSCFEKEEEMSRRTEFRNEVKTRLSDKEFVALQAFKALHGIDGDSAGLARIVRLHLFGAVGNLPANLTTFSADMAQGGTQVNA